MFKKGGDFVIFSPYEALLYIKESKDKSCDHVVFGKPSMHQKTDNFFQFHRPITLLLNNPNSNRRSCDCVNF